MIKTEVFRGIGTALITPFKNEKIDYASLEKLINTQIGAGIHALIIGGTTAEAATLTDKERYELFQVSREMIGGRCKLIFGTGTNDTRVAIKHTEYASNLGCDGVLLVTPYYNRGTRDGVIKHYEAISDISGVPIILYNVPSRTGVNLTIDVLEKLAERDNIVGIKEASDSHDRLCDLSAFGDALHLYAGNDSALFTVLSLGGAGVISVVSNIFPKEAVEIYNLFSANKRDEALKKQKKLLPVINSLFLETNPAPIKYAMSRAGMCSSDMRLPMWLPTEQSRRRIDEAILSYLSNEE